MKLHEIGPTPGATQRKKRVGRGDSSGMGKTCCRGEKGQKSRTGTTLRPFFEGGQTPFFRRIPKRGFNSPDHVFFQLINLSVLEDNFDADAVVDADALREKSLLGKKELLIKVLANGEITKPLVVKAHKFSQAAKEKIEAVGGKCEVIEA